MTAKPAAGGSMLSRLGGGLVILILGLAYGCVVALSPDIAAAILVLQVPGLIALLLDRTPGRAVARTMLLFQGAASVHPVISIWYQCEGVRACVALTSERRTLLLVWLAAAGGWVLTQTLPLVLKLVDEARMKRHRDRLTTERERLVAEWELEKTSDT